MATWCACTILLRGHHVTILFSPPPGTLQAPGGGRIRPSPLSVPPSNQTVALTSAMLSVRINTMLFAYSRCSAPHPMMVVLGEFYCCITHGPPGPLGGGPISPIGHRGWVVGECTCCASRRYLPFQQPQSAPCFWFHFGWYLMVQLQQHLPRCCSPLGQQSGRIPPWVSRPSCHLLCNWL